jgi:hypothetical protein
LTRAEVISAIDDFLHRRGGAWDWDDFFSTPLDDPELEQVRLFCGRLPDEYPRLVPNEYCGPEGIAALRKVLEELRALETASET